MRGAIGSLNAAVAGSVLLFEAVAQRDPEGRAGEPGPTDSADAPDEPVDAERLDDSPTAAEGETAADGLTEPIDSSEVEESIQSWEAGRSWCKAR